MFGRRRQFRKGRRWFVVLALYMVILAAFVGALWYFIPPDVVDAVRDTYLNPSAAIDP